LDICKFSIQPVDIIRESPNLYDLSDILCANKYLLGRFDMAILSWIRASGNHDIFAMVG